MAWPMPLHLSNENSISGPILQICTLGSWYTNRLEDGGLEEEASSYFLG